MYWRIYLKSGPCYSTSRPLRLTCGFLDSTHTHPCLLPYVFVVLEQASQGVVPRSVTSASLGNSLDLQVPRLTSDPVRQELCRGGPALCVLTSTPGWTHAGVLELLLYSVSALPCSLSQIRSPEEGQMAGLPLTTSWPSGQHLAGTQGTCVSS